MAKRKSTEWIIVHCSWTRADQDIGAAEIDEWHRGRGWDGIGYHFVIRRDGIIEPGRHLARKGAHCKGENHRSVGVCLVGGMAAGKGKADEDNFTNSQKMSLAVLISAMSRFYPRAGIAPHRQFDKTKTCPVFDLGKFMRGTHCNVTVAR